MKNSFVLVICVNILYRFVLADENLNDFIHESTSKANETKSDYFRGAIYVPSDHVEDFEETMTPFIDESDFENDHGRHRALGNSIRWCRYCDLEYYDGTNKGGCYYRRDFDGYFTYKRHLVDDEEYSEISAYGTTLDSEELPMSDEIHTEDRKLRNKHKRRYRSSHNDKGDYGEWRCYDAWKKGSFRGYRYQGNSYAYLDEPYDVGDDIDDFDNQRLRNRVSNRRYRAGDDGRYSARYGDINYYDNQRLRNRVSNRRYRVGDDVRYRTRYDNIYRTRYDGRYRTGDYDGRYRSRYDGRVRAGYDGRIGDDYDDDYYLYGSKKGRYYRYKSPKGKRYRYGYVSGSKKSPKSKYYRYGYYSGSKKSPKSKYDRYDDYYYSGSRRNLRSNNERNE